MTAFKPKVNLKLMVMKAKYKFRMSSSERQKRYFSKEFKIKKVQEIESGRTKVLEVCKEYEVSRTSVYRWLQKFGAPKNKYERMVVESKSDTQAILALKEKVAELEKLVGQKEVLLAFKDKMIEYMQDNSSEDIKKKLSNIRSTISGKTGKS